MPDIPEKCPKCGAAPNEYLRDVPKMRTLRSLLGYECGSLIHPEFSQSRVCYLRQKVTALKAELAAEREDRKAVLAAIGKAREVEAGQIAALKEQAESAEAELEESAASNQEVGDCYIDQILALTKEHDSLRADLERVTLALENARHALRQTEKNAETIAEQRDEARGIAVRLFRQVNPISCPEPRPDWAKEGGR